MDQQTSSSPSASIAKAQIQQRKKKFKNAGRDPKELRKKRLETGIELRKSAKLEQLAKRRNITSEAQLLESEILESNATNETGIQPVSFIFDDSAVQKFILDIIGENFDAQRAATSCVRKILICNPPKSFCELLFMSGATKRFVEFLRLQEHPELQFEAAWILTNLLSGNSEETEYIVNLGVIKPLIELLSSPQNELIHQALWALGNIAGDTRNYRDALIDLGILPPLSVIVRSQSTVNLMKRIAWIISNMCRIKNPSPTMDAVRQFVPILGRLMLVEDLETLIDATWALSYLSDGVNERIEELMDSGCIPRLAHLLHANSYDLIFPCIRTIGNIITGTYSQVSAITSTSAISTLIKLLLCDKMSIVKEASWALSNLAAGLEEHIQILIQKEAIPNVFHVLRNGDSQAKGEAVWIVANIAAGGNPSQIYYLCEKGVIECLCDLLSPSEDPVTLISVIDCFANIVMGAEELDQGNRVRHVIEVCGGASKIENLQTHPNPQVCSKAMEFIDLHFSASYENIDESRPVDSDQFGHLDVPVNSPEDEAEGSNGWGSWE